jgi:thiamine-monophosphate kinase
MFENTERTELSALGEFGLISHLSKHFTSKNDSTVLGIGDDAAIVKLGNEMMAISTDSYIEGVHFDLMFHPLKHLGYKAVAATVSDICAMNAIPTQILVGIGLSNRFSLEAVEELYEGMRLACEKYNVDLIGGDTSSSRSGLVLNLTAMGRVEESKLTLRKGAQATHETFLRGLQSNLFLLVEIFAWHGAQVGRFFLQPLLSEESQAYLPFYKHLLVFFLWMIWRLP